MLQKSENLLIAGGVLVAAIGIVMATHNTEVLLSSSCIVLGVGLFSSTMSRKAGWVLLVISTVLFVLAMPD